MKSMTGFGRAKYSDKNYDIEIEIKSLNSRFLDCKFKVPVEISFIEPEINKLICNSIKRGKVDVYLNYNIKKAPELELNEESLKTYWHIYKKAKEALKVNTELSFEKVLGEKDVIVVKSKDTENSVFLKAVINTFKKALNEHQNMAFSEGQSMKRFLKTSISSMNSSLKFIEREFPKFKKEISEKFKYNIENILNKKFTDDDYKRILLEVSFYIGKADVTEEIVRLKNHIDKFKEKMNINSEAGKSLNFILQEMQREINTIGSKFTSIKVFNSIISIKEEIEKCREIVQNVE